MIIDSADPQPAEREPCRMGPVWRNGFVDGGVRNPMKFHPASPATGKEIDVATTEKIETQIERGIGQCCKHRSGDQAIAAPIDQRNRTTVVIGWPECGMVGKPTLGLVIEIREHRPADDVRSGGL